MISVDILNQIAKSEALNSSLGKRLFNLKSDEELNQIIDKLVAASVLKGYDLYVALAVTELIPYCLEHIAITNFILKHEATGLRSVLPEILNPAEALHFAKGDFYQIRDSKNLQNQFIFLFKIMMEEQNYLTYNA